MTRTNIILDKSVNFALQVIQLTKTVHKDIASIVIAKQLIRSGTSIGANVTEAQDASSRKDFTQKMAIALRESKESKYWLFLLAKTDLSTQKAARLLYSKADEISAILSTIVKSSKQ